MKAQLAMSEESILHDRSMAHPENHVLSWFVIFPSLETPGALAPDCHTQRASHFYKPLQRLDASVECET